MVQSSHAIDGKFLVLSDKTALPPRCVKSNQPVDERAYRTWDLPWMPLWLRIIMLLSPAFLLFAPFVIRRRCHLKAALSHTAWLRFFFLKLTAVLLIIGSFVFPIIYATAGMDAWAFYAAIFFPIFLWGGFAILILFSSPLSIAKHKGDLFWIKGCSPAFLESLRESVEAETSTAS